MSKDDYRFTLLLVTPVIFTLFSIVIYVGLNANCNLFEPTPIRDFFYSCVFYGGLYSLFHVLLFTTLALIGGAFGDEENEH